MQLGVVTETRLQEGDLAEDDEFFNRLPSQDLKAGSDQIHVRRCYGCRRAERMSRSSLAVTSPAHFMFLMVLKSETHMKCGPSRQPG